MAFTWTLRVEYGREIDDANRQCGRLNAAATFRNGRRRLMLVALLPLLLWSRPRRWSANCPYLFSEGSTEEATDLSRLLAHKYMVRTCGAGPQAFDRLLRRRATSSRAARECRESGASPPS